MGDMEDMEDGEMDAETNKENNQLRGLRETKVHRCTNCKMDNHTNEKCRYRAAPDARPY